MKSLLFLATFILCSAIVSHAQTQVEIPDYKNASLDPSANYRQIVTNVRAKFQLKKQQLIAQGVDVKKSDVFREEVAQFERWAMQWRDKIGIDGRFPDPLTGWINAMREHPEMFKSQQHLQNPVGISTIPWTSIGPVNSGSLNGWPSGGGIGRINVVRRHPQLLGTFFAGTATGGLFKSTDLGSSWTPATDQLAGLGVSDVVILPNNPNHMLMATGDFDGSGSINSIGIFKSTDGGATWPATPLPFTLDQKIKIAHLYVDPDFGVNNTVWATTTNSIFRSVNGGDTWTDIFTVPDEGFNDFVKVGTQYFASSKKGKLYKSTDGNIWTNEYTLTVGASKRIDFAFSPNTPNTLYILTGNNPAFSKYTISPSSMAPFTNVTNSVPADANGNFNSQQNYNQVIAANPLNGNDLMITEYSGKRSLDGGSTWTNHLNGYYSPAGSANWGGGYVHSDHHFTEYIGALADSLLIGCDGGVYIGPVNTFAYKECFQGLVCTQSYSISIFNTEPNNLIIGNQDNDGRSRVYDGTTSTWFAAQAGDGIATAIHRTNKDRRFLTGTTGTLSYTNDGFQGGYQGKEIDKPNDGIFDAPFEMHLTNGDILYGGFADVYKSTGITVNPPGTNDNANWVNLTSGLGDKPKFIGLSNHPTDPLKQRIVAIGENDVVRKTTDEINWTTITVPVGVTFNSIYWSRNSDTMIATASGYNAGNKVFFSSNAGGSWTSISDNMPNIQMVNSIRLEGTDTVFVATELGVYFAKLNPTGGVFAPQAIGWTKFGTGLPNVKVSDMEISYAKRQLFISTYGRGVWMVNLNLNALATSGILFSYNNFNAQQYRLNWKIDATDIIKTVLEKSISGSNFTSVAAFTDGLKKDQPSYLVAKENRNVYYRLHYVNSTGAKLYSQTIALRNTKGSFNINVFPNPATDYVTISSAVKMSTVKIISPGGIQHTYAQPNSNLYSFDMSLLPKGIYVVQVWDVEGNMVSDRIVRK